MQTPVEAATPQQLIIAYLAPVQQDDFINYLDG